MKKIFNESKKKWIICQKCLSKVSTTYMYLYKCCVLPLNPYKALKQRKNWLLANLLKDCQFCITNKKTEEILFKQVFHFLHACNS